MSVAAADWRSFLVKQPKQFPAARDDQSRCQRAIEIKKLKELEIKKPTSTIRVPDLILE